MTERKWHFEFYEEERGGWFLRIDTPEDVVAYESCCDMLDKDKRHHKYLEAHPQSNRINTIVAHTEFGYLVNHIKESAGVETDDAYDIIRCLQAGSMLKILASGKTLLVNRKGGFRVRREGEKPKGSVWRTKLDFPRYLSNEIRVKRFDDGRHYYAYIGDMQVKDGDVVKWNTYDEAYSHAEKFAIDWRNSHLN